jgi:hypothetical protein
MTLHLGQFHTPSMSSIWVQCEIARASAALLREMILNENFEFVKDRQDPRDESWSAADTAELWSETCGHSLIRHRYNRILCISLTTCRRSSSWSPTGSEEAHLIAYEFPTTTQRFFTLSFLIVAVSIHSIRVIESFHSFSGSVAWRLRYITHRFTLIDERQSTELSTIFDRTNFPVSSLHFTFRVTPRRYNIRGRCEVKSVRDSPPIRENCLRGFEGWFPASLLSWFSSPATARTCRLRLPSSPVRCLATLCRARSSSMLVQCSFSIRETR